MKKSLEAELISIAHRILQLKNKEDIHELKTITGVLYEKLSVLSFAEKHFAGAQPTIGLKDVKEKIADTAEEKEKVVEKNSEHEEASAPTGLEHNTEGIIELNTDILKSILAEMPMEKIQAIKQNARPDGLEYNKEAITEPNTEKIKDMVAQMFPEANEVDEVLEENIPEQKEEKKQESPKENKAEQNFGVSYDDLPQFEPVPKMETPQPPKEEPKQEEEKPKPEPEVPQEQPEAPTEEASTEPETKLEEELPKEKENPAAHDLFQNYETPEFEPKEQSATKNDLGGERKSLNDRLKKGINIGLNDRLAYIKHLFDGNAADYNRVLSQLNTIETFTEAHQFIQQQIKPDYNNWENKDVYEARFLHAIKNKYD